MKGPPRPAPSGRLPSVGLTDPRGVRLGHLAEAPPPPPPSTLPSGGGGARVRGPHGGRGFGPSNSRARYLRTCLESSASETCLLAHLLTSPSYVIRDSGLILGFEFRTLLGSLIQLRPHPVECELVLPLWHTRPAPALRSAGGRRAPDVTVKSQQNGAGAVRMGTPPTTPTPASSESALVPESKADVPPGRHRPRGWLGEEKGVREKTEQNKGAAWQIVGPNGLGTDHLPSVATDRGRRPLSSESSASKHRGKGGTPPFRRPGLGSQRQSWRPSTRGPATRSHGQGSPGGRCPLRPQPPAPAPFPTTCNVPGGQGPGGHLPPFGTASSGWSVLFKCLFSRPC